MKILYINKFYHPWIGGIETVCQKLAEGVAKTKINKVAVLCCNDKYKRERFILNKVRIFKSATLFITLGMPVSIDFFRLFKKLSKSYDIIHLHWPFPLAFIALIFFKPQAKIVITWHADIVRQRLFGPLLRPFVRYALNIADIIIAPTKNHVMFSPWLKEFKDKISIIPFGIETDFYRKVPITEIKKIKNFFKNKKIILSVGRLNYYKGIEYLIKALPLIKQSVKNVICIIIGSGSLKSSLKRLAQSLNVEGDVVFLGKIGQKKIKTYFLACDIFVLPSLYKSEAFGLVQLEAMLAKKPVINTNLASGVPLVSTHQKTGFTVPPRNPQALAEAIISLLNNEQLRIKFGNNAFKRVIKVFPLTKMIKLHQRLYRQLKQKT